MKQQFDNLINEFTKNGKLTPYKDIIIEVISDIHKKGFTISTRYDNIQSVIDWSNNHIRISFKKEDPIFIVFDLLHEYGHLLSGKKMGNDTKRESLAWDIAEQLIEKFHALNCDIDKFRKYKDYCLNG